MQETRVVVGRTISTPYHGIIRALGLVMLVPILVAGVSMAVTIPMGVIGLSLMTFSNGFSVNLTTKTYREYLWLFGLHFGKEESFERIEYLFLKQNRIAMDMSSRGMTRSVRSNVYDGYIRFSESDKVHLFRGTTKEEVMKKLVDLSAQLNVDILDYTKS